MDFGFITYNEQNVVSIDSKIHGFSLTEIETYTTQVDARYKAAGWEIRCGRDEILVLGESTHMVAVHSIDPRAETMLIGVMGSYQTTHEQMLGLRPPQQASVKIYRFSSRPPTKKGALDIYTDDGYLAFTSTQPMLRPQGFFPVPEGEKEQLHPILDERAVEYPAAPSRPFIPPTSLEKPLGVVLDISMRRFSLRQAGYQIEVARALLACYKVTPKCICRQLVNRNTYEEVTWSGRTFELFPKNRWLFPIQEGLLVFL